MESQIHKVRDGLASGLLISALLEGGYEYGGPILNLPETVAEELDLLGKIRHVDASASNLDLLLLTTRPPLDDSEAGENNVKRPILCSRNNAEMAVFERLRTFFMECSRGRVILQPKIHLPPDAEHFRNLWFKQSGGALIKQPSHPCLVNRTAAYMLSTPPMRPDGPRLVAAFGMGGTETLLLAYLIRTHQEFSRAFRDLLRDGEPRLTIVTFLVPSYIPHPYLSYDLEELDGRLVVSESVE
jgi:hypothetical protein